MKCKILLLLVTTVVVTHLQAQSNKKSKQQNPTGYAITAMEKGGRGWKEVKLVDLVTGEVLKSVYQSSQEIQPLNARTGKAISIPKLTEQQPVRKIVNLDQALEPGVRVRRVSYVRERVSPEKPFATNSAACAYDKKHERLYYTPMSINQLRYIDLRSGNIFYFENENFGKVSGTGDIANQITRMVIASDGNGYALTNDARNLIRFTTGKKPVITELGALTDDPANTRSVHVGNNYGGDMVADAAGNLYLITANRHVYKINIESKAAAYLGAIKGLPQGFSTNGAMVEAESKVIIASSESTLGYFRFDLNTLQAEKITGAGTVFNASDLANGNLAFSKKKKEKPAPAEQEVTNATTREEEPVTESLTENTAQPGISVFPNPVTNGLIKLTFNEQPAGRYKVQLLDITGRVVGTKEVNVNGPAQVEEFRFPELSVKGNYLIQVTNELNKIHVTDKIVVQ